MSNEKKSKKELFTVIIAMVILVIIAFAFIFFFPLGKDKQEQQSPAENTEEVVNQEENAEPVADKTGLANETAKDGEIDFEALQAENPDIFAWIYIPGTDIDYPILQSEEADDYYESHNAYGENSQEGAIYKELANLKNMCDFNTVLHGKTEDEKAGEGLFADLYQFANPDFFEEHANAYIYLPGNVLTYEIFAAYEREDTSLIRTYDFTYIAGCQKFLDDMYGTREMGKLIRTGWEEVAPNNFLITLTTKSDATSDKQYIVIGAMTGDAAGAIEGVVVE